MSAALDEKSALLDQYILEKQALADRIRSLEEQASLNSQVAKKMQSRVSELEGVNTDLTGRFNQAQVWACVGEWVYLCFIICVYLYVVTVYFSDNLFVCRLFVYSFVRSIVCLLGCLFGLVWFGLFV